MEEYPPLGEIGFELFMHLFNTDSISILVVVYYSNLVEYIIPNVSFCIPNPDC